MWIDVVFAIVAAAAFYWGFSRGIIRTVISVIAIFVGLIVAVRFAEATTLLLSDLFNTAPDGAMPLIGFVTAFVIVLALLRLLSAAIERLLTATRLNFINQLAGGLATAFVATLVFSVLLMFVNAANLISLHAKAESVTYESLAAFPAHAYAMLGQAQPTLEHLRDAGKEAMGNN